MARAIIAINNGNVFEALMDAVHACSLGQITHALSMSPMLLQGIEVAGSIVEICK